LSLCSPYASVTAAMGSSSHTNQKINYKIVLTTNLYHSLMQGSQDKYTGWLKMIWAIIQIYWQESLTSFVITPQIYLHAINMSPWRYSPLRSI